MEYGKLGNTDIEVSKLCVGCMSFGKAGTMHDWTLDEAESENVIKHRSVSSTVQEEKNEQNDNIFQGMRFLCAEDNELNAEILT